MPNPFRKKQAEQARQDRLKHQQKSTADKIKRPTKTPAFEDYKIADMPDFGLDTSVAAQSQSVNSAFAQMQKDMQQALNDRMQHRIQQNSNLQNLLNQSGAGHMAIAYNTPYPSGSPQSNAGPKFNQGDRVTVRTGKTIWTIQHCRIENAPWGRQIIYEMTEEKGRVCRELEEDLIAYDGKSAKAQVNFDTVIIADEKRQQILEAIEQINQHELIFEEWGFGETIEKGKGVSMLFYGPPGTGKTLMAQAIANKLDYVLKVISTADVESSKPGEAERNIRKHFKDANNGKTILLFDECDSLIFTREHVGPILSAQINELLSQIERFNGITLFTTNRLGTLDEAVNRRLALKLEFAMPSPEERALIWQRMFPKKAPLADDINWNKLAIVEITGGYIKNVVLRAARMAAIEKVSNAKKKITMKHLVKALRLETASMIEFEEARNKHRGGIGHVDHGRVVQSGSDMEIVEGGM